MEREVCGEVHTGHTGAASMFRTSHVAHLRSLGWNVSVLSQCCWGIVDADHKPLARATYLGQLYLGKAGHRRGLSDSTWLDYTPRPPSGPSKPSMPFPLLADMDTDTLVTQSAWA